MFTFRNLNEKEALELFKKNFNMHENKARISDYAILQGGYVSDKYFIGIKSHSDFLFFDADAGYISRRYEEEYKKDHRKELLKNRTGFWWLDEYKNHDLGNEENICATTRGYHNGIKKIYSESVGARPVIDYLEISSLTSSPIENEDGILEVEFGEYPQTVESERNIGILETMYQSKKLKITGKKYTSYVLDKSDNEEIKYKILERNEYEFNGNKYVRIIGNGKNIDEVLSNDKEILDGEVYWVKVEPVKWLLDDEANLVMCKNIIFAGIPYDLKVQNDINKTEIKKYMDKYFSHQIIPSEKNLISNNEFNEHSFSLEQQEELFYKSNIMKKKQKQIIDKILDVCMIRSEEYSSKILITFFQKMLLNFLNSDEPIEEIIKKIGLLSDEILPYMDYQKKLSNCNFTKNK